MVVATVTELFPTLYLLQEELLMIAPRTTVLAITDRLNLSSYMTLGVKPMGKIFTI